MRAEEWILQIKQQHTKGDFTLTQLPLGVDEKGEVVLSHRQNRRDRYCHTCVTGRSRTSFLVDTVRALTKLYGEGKATFFILSPRREYLPLLGLKGGDITLPYLRTEKDYAKMKSLVLAQMEARRQKPDYPPFFLVLDGLYELPFIEKDSYLSLYREMIEEAKGGAEVLTAVDFEGSIFSGFPGAFVGVGNSLVSADEEGTADVTHVLENCALDCPKRVKTYHEEG